eukprot:scaffold82497_cov14-Tisochrysis_lutea.AAC.1
MMNREHFDPTAVKIAQNNHDGPFCVQAQGVLPYAGRPASGLLVMVLEHLEAADTAVLVNRSKCFQGGLIEVACIYREC